MTPARVRWRGRYAGAAIALAIAHAAGAQTHRCAPGSIFDSASTGRRWSAPLDRPVTLHASDLSLRDALDRVAALARIRLSYSAELLPLDRRVCASADSAPAGRVLDDLLSATNVVAVTAGGDQVVLSPRPAGNERSDAAPQLARSVGVLDRVVVTGSATSAPARELSVGVDVLSGEKLRRENVNTLSEALDAYVPGMWSWAQSPSNMLNSYASIRGASSFGLSYPKIYIDGIEVANPLLLSRFNATSIDRIEVIRGPQGSALYGTDAISGVINIVTRHEGAGDRAMHAELQSTAGMSESAYAHDVLAQDHTLALVSGSSTRSADLHVEAGSMGAFVPDGYSRQLLANAAARVVGTSGTLSSTARLYVEQAGAGNSVVTIDRPGPSVDSLPGSQPTSRSPQSVTEYTLGTNATLFGNERWTHSFVVGVDGYRLANVQTNYTPVPSVVDSALRAAQGGADRGTIRASSVMQLNAGEPTRATLTFSAEHAALRLSALEPSRLLAADHMPHASLVERSATTWQNSTGVGAQVNVAVDDLFFATGGVRVERDSRLAADERIAALPMLGVAAVRDYGPLNVKLRASFGKGIRPPTTATRWQLLQPGIIGQQTPLGPEVQSGTEVGLDVALQRVLFFQLTRFDQRASGLIQQVAIGMDSGPEARRMAYAAENVGEIANSGWEMAATGDWSRLSATGALTFVDSRVRRVAAGYTGDLMAGDRMLQVPARTASLNLAWTAPDWHAALTGSRALDWINYDELALAQAWVSESRSPRDFVGPQLRDYWRRYNGGLRLRASASRDLRPDLSFEISADNLLNYQRGEPDNITIVPGRTIMTGVRIKF